MNIKNSFNGFIKRILSGIRRFPLSAFFGFAVFVSAAFFLFAPEPEGGGKKAASALSDIALQASFASALAFFTCTTASLAAQRFSFVKKVRIPLYAFSAALWGLGFFLAKRMYDFHYAHRGIICICILAGLYLCITASNEKTVFLHICKSLALAELIALIVFFGLALSLWAVDELFITEYIFEDYVLVIFIFSQAVIAANVFLSQLTVQDGEFPVSRAAKVIVFYTAFPVYILFVAVLYVYLAKILVTRNMPDGQINIFVSLATMMSGRLFLLQNVFSVFRPLFEMPGNYA
jgi:membrane protein